MCCPQTPLPPSAPQCAQGDKACPAETEALRRTWRPAWRPVGPRAVAGPSAWGSEPARAGLWRGARGAEAVSADSAPQDTRRVEAAEGAGAGRFASARRPGHLLAGGLAGSTAAAQRSAEGAVLAEADRGAPMPASGAAGNTGTERGAGSGPPPRSQGSGAGSVKRGVGPRAPRAQRASPAAGVAGSQHPPPPVPRLALRHAGLCLRPHRLSCPLGVSPNFLHLMSHRFLGITRTPL